MAIYEIMSDRIAQVAETTFGRSGVKERTDLQRLLREYVEVVAPNTMVIAEEYGQWDDSKRRIDLLGLDKQANLVVIELKRTEDGGHMDLQAIRYAAMVSTMTFDQVVAARDAFQNQRSLQGDARQEVLDFLEWDVPNEDLFAQEVRIVLVAADFSRELTTSVIWLNTHDLDIRCVRLKPYSLDGRILVDVQQVIPLPEAAEYQVHVREKVQKERKAKQSNVDFTRYDVSIKGVVHQGQWKRRAILLVIRALIDNGVTPEQLTELLSWRKGRLWISVNGKVDREAFLKGAEAAAAQLGKRFEFARWFCGEGELMFVGGRTYAFSNQWGNSWPDAMRALVEEYPEFAIAYAPTTSVANEAE